MGHYAADMRPEWFDDDKRTDLPPSTDNFWIVGDGFTVLRAIDFEKSGGRMGYFKRMSKQHFEFREHAETAARIGCENAVENTRADLTRLKNILKVQRPWEQKNGE